MSQMPREILTKNGLVVANFCSEKPFFFDTRQTLKACDKDRVARLSPIIIKKIVMGDKGEKHVFYDTHVSEHFKNAVHALDAPKCKDIDIVLVSLKVFTAMKRDKIWHPKIRLPILAKRNKEGPVWSSEQFQIDPFIPELDTFDEVLSTWEEIRGLYSLAATYLEGK